MAHLIETAQIATALALLLLAAHAVGRLFSYLRQPRVIGEIVGGLLLGPTVLSSLLPEAAAWAFPKSSSLPSVLWLASQTGLVLLMYAAGAQLRTIVPRGEKRIVAALSLTGILLPFVTGLAAVTFIDQAKLQGSAHHDVAFLLVFATAIAIASIPVISRIMLDLGIMRTPFARIVIATAVLDDLALYVVLAVAVSLAQPHSQAAAGWSALVGLPASWEPVGHVVVTLLAIAVTLWAGPRLFRRGLRLDFAVARWDHGAVVQLAILLAVAGLCLGIGVNPMFGALAIGAAVGQVSQQQSLGESRSISRFGAGVVVPLYFAIVGLKLDLLHHFDALFFLGFLVFACAVKALSIYLGARIAGETRSTAMNFAVALNARGGPGIVLATVSYDAGIINENFFASLVLLAIVTSMMAGSWLGAIVRRGELRPGDAAELAGTRKSPTSRALGVVR